LPPRIPRPVTVSPPLVVPVSSCSQSAMFAASSAAPSGAC
jgi:hypothetical protein